MPGELLIPAKQGIQGPHALYPLWIFAMGGAEATLFVQRPCVGMSGG
jgi:hypothetical protein